MGGTFTFIASQSSKKSEISVEEVGSYSLNASRLENESMLPESNMTIENVDSSSDIHQRSDASRQLSIVSVASEDDKNKSCDDNDDAMEDLLTRIKKQRSDLENILGIERKLSEENSSKNIATKQLREDDKEVAATTTTTTSIKKDEVIEGTFHLL